MINENVVTETETPGVKAETYADVSALPGEVEDPPPVSREEWFEYKTLHRMSALDSDNILRAEVRYDNRCGNRYPHFAITGTGFTRRVLRGEERVTFEGGNYWSDRGGCLHEEIAATFPELASLIQWHLVDTAAPMHYIANGMYFHELWSKKVAGAPWDEEPYVARSTEEQHRATFARSVLHGVCSDDPPLDSLLLLEPVQLRGWLEHRLPELRRKFQEALAHARSLQETLCAPQVR